MGDEMMEAKTLPFDPDANVMVVNLAQQKERRVSLDNPRQPNLGWFSDDLTRARASMGSVRESKRQEAENLACSLAGRNGTHGGTLSPFRFLLSILTSRRGR